MAEITLAFLKQARENVHQQGQQRADALQQSVGAVAVLDQLIAHLEAPAAPPMKDDVLGIRHSNVVTVDEIRAASVQNGQAA